MVVFLGLVYRNLNALIGKFSNGLDFERSDKYGWLTMNMNLLGTGMCCKIRLKLQHAIEHIENAAKKSGIKINSIDENQCENGCIVELTNLRTFGLSEFECVQQFYDGIKKFMEMMENIENHNDTTGESNEIDTHNELCKNANESNECEVDGDGTEQPATNEIDPANQNDDNEQKIDNETHGIDENVEKAEVVGHTDTAQSDPNETLANAEENIDEKNTAIDEDNTINVLEPNNVNENNDTVNEEEKINEITETAPIEPNELENEASEQPNPTEDHDTKEADSQPIEV